MADVFINGGTLTGTSAADTLWSYESEFINDTQNWRITLRSGLNGKGGNDYLDNVVVNAKLDGSKGNDYIHNHAAKVTILGGKGNDYILNYNLNSTTYFIGGKAAKGNYKGTSSLSIDGGDGDDTILNGGYDSYSPGSTVIGGKGNDLIGSYGSYVSISGGAGNDIIDDEGNDTHSTISGDKGNDSISGTGSYNLLDGGTGDDYIHSIGKNNTLLCGDGNDSLQYQGTSSVNSNLLMNDTIGNNYFSAWYTTKGTILGGAGDDTVELYSDKKVSVNVGAGNNSIKAQAGNSNVTITAGKGNDTIEFDDDSAKKFVINAGDGANYIGVYNRYENASSNYTIKSGSGNDVVNNNGGNHALISTGAGNDTIRNSYNHNFTPSNTISAYNTIDAGKGNDLIINNAENVTITAGKGNDTIILNDSYYDSVAGDKALINYKSGDGKDFIQGFGENSTLSISGSEYSTKKSGDDLIVTVGKGKITLDGAASLDALNITSDYIKVTDSTKSPVTVDSSIKTIDASSRNKAVKITGNKIANSIVGGTGNDKLYGGKGNDCVIGGKGNDSLWGEKGNDTFIYSSGDGKDIIYGFEDGDTLTLDNLDFKASYKSGDVIFKVDGGSITLKDFTATTFHINNDTYQITGKNKFVKK